MTSYGREQVAQFSGATINQIRRWTDIGLIAPEHVSGDGRPGTRVRRRMYSLWNCFEAALLRSVADVTQDEKMMASVLEVVRTSKQSLPGDRKTMTTWRETAEMNHRTPLHERSILLLLYPTRRSAEPWIDMLHYAYKEALRLFRKTDASTKPPDFNEATRGIFLLCSDNGLAAIASRNSGPAFAHFHAFNLVTILDAVQSNAGIALTLDARQRRKGRDLDLDTRYAG